MHYPALNDTIIAVSTGWQPAPLGIVRLSGPDARTLAKSILVPGNVETHPAAIVEHPGVYPARLRWESGHELPADLFLFRAPHSYTGQDLVELHTVGSLPLLRVLCARLIAAGARRALPGEFTARAFLNGKLDAAAVDGVLGLLHAGNEAAARHASRQAHARRTALLDDILQQLTDLLAAIEAGIDFVDEEDVRFITPAETRKRIDAVLERLSRLETAAGDSWRAAQPHVALVGLPNAGKSTLFNALLGSERTIVSPVLGTTRDVISAELHLGGVSMVLQDSAGLGNTQDELDLAAHNATERAAGRADLVVWAHDAQAAWPQREMSALRAIPADRRLVVLTKSDLRPSPENPSGPPETGNAIRVSAATGDGLSSLRSAIVKALSGHQPAQGIGNLDDIRAAETELMAARALVSHESETLENEELVSLQLRMVLGRLLEAQHGSVVETVLGSIFARFCIGK